MSMSELKREAQSVRTRIQDESAVEYGARIIEFFTRANIVIKNNQANKEKREKKKASAKKKKEESIPKVVRIRRAFLQPGTEEFENRQIK